MKLYSVCIISFILASDASAMQPQKQPQKPSLETAGSAPLEPWLEEAWAKFNRDFLEGSSGASSISFEDSKAFDSLDSEDASNSSFSPYNNFDGFDYGQGPNGFGSPFLRQASSPDTDVDMGVKPRANSNHTNSNSSNSSSSSSYSFNSNSNSNSSNSYTSYSGSSLSLDSSPTSTQGSSSSSGSRSSGSNSSSGNNSQAMNAGLNPSMSLTPLPIQTSSLSALTLGSSSNSASRPSKKRSRSRSNEAGMMSLDEAVRKFNPNSGSNSNSNSNSNSSSLDAKKSDNNNVATQMDESDESDESTSDGWVLLNTIYDLKPRYPQRQGGSQTLAPLPPPVSLVPFQMEIPNSVRATIYGYLSNTEITLMLADSEFRQEFDNADMLVKFKSLTLDPREKITTNLLEMEDDEEDSKGSNVAPEGAKIGKPKPKPKRKPTQGENRGPKPRRKLVRFFVRLKLFANGDTLPKNGKKNVQDNIHQLFKDCGNEITELEFDSKQSFLKRIQLPKTLNLTCLRMGATSLSADNMGHVLKATGRELVVLDARKIIGGTGLGTLTAFLKENLDLPLRELHVGGSEGSAPDVRDKWSRKEYDAPAYMTGRTANSLAYALVHGLKDLTTLELKNLWVDRVGYSILVKAIEYREALADGLTVEAPEVGLKYRQRALKNSALAGSKNSSGNASSSAGNAARDADSVGSDIQKPKRKKHKAVTSTQNTDRNDNADNGDNSDNADNGDDTHYMEDEES